MKIREGAYYRTRGGYVVGPMEKTGHGNYPWSSLHDCWTDDGRFNIADDECEADLISEVYFSDTPPADALTLPSAMLKPQDWRRLKPIEPSPEAKNLRDEFASDWMKGVLANPNNADGDMESFSRMAYRMADAMMEARKK